MSFFHKTKWEQFKRYFSLPPFLLGVFATSIVFVLATVILIPKNNLISQSGQGQEEAGSLFIKPVSAAEIYEEFICTCCGRTLDPDNICCGEMKQKIDYIDSLVGSGLSRDEIMLKTTKEFGIDSLAKAEVKKAMKEQLLANAPKNAAKISMKELIYDFGKISQADGMATAIFNFTNDGKSDLIIKKMDTSCGCTSASIVYKGEEGPLFGMNMGKNKDPNKNPTDWSVSIAPGDEAQLKVVYDPNKHGPQKEDSMSITRSISLFSNDPVEFETKVKIQLEQVR